MNDRIQNFQKSKTYEGQCTLSEADADLATISNLDEIAEAKKKKWKIVLGISAAAFVFSLIFGDLLGAAAYPAHGASLFLLIVSVVYLFKEGKLDTEDRRGIQEASMRMVTPSGSILVDLTVSGSSNGQRARICFDRAKRLGVKFDDLGLMPKQAELLRLYRESGASRKARETAWYLWHLDPGSLEAARSLVSTLQREEEVLTRLYVLENGLKRHPGDAGLKALREQTVLFLGIGKQ